MQRILAHNNGDRKYRGVLRHLQNNTIDINTQNLHNNIFDLTYIYKPDILLYPINEYTQEIHNFIVSHKISCVLFIDTTIPQDDLLTVLQKHDHIKFIVNKNTNYQLTNSIWYDQLYDDNIFRKLDNIERNNKIAVSLSYNNDVNHQYLDQYIIPNHYQYPIVLFNNPEFKHPQNIGIYNEPDLNYVLNSFSYFVDMDKEFEVEASVSQIKLLDHTTNLSVDSAVEPIPDAKLQSYKISEFVSNILIPFLGTK